MIEGGRIERKNHRKAPPIYVGPDSYHDPAVVGAIMPGVGHRLRITNSKDEYFEESVNDAAKGFAISGYNYQKAKQELLKFKDQDPVELIKRPRREKKKPEKGVQAFFITEYDAIRMPHPRKLAWPLPKEESGGWDKERKEPIGDFVTNSADWTRTTSWQWWW